MLLVILGAGASHGCIPGDSPSALPVTAGLFDLGEPGVAEANQFSPHAGSVVARVSSAVRSNPSNVDIEAVLGQIAMDAERRGGDMATQLLAMRFWLLERIRVAQARVMRETAGITLYTTLLNVLDDWGDSHLSKVALITFNYDTLVDGALAAHSLSISERTGVRGEVGQFAVAGGRWSLFRPHGSIGWTRSWETDYPRENSPNSVIRSFAGQDPEETWFVDAPYVQRGEHPLEPTLSIPAIAVPLSRKSAFECPASQVETMRGAIIHATRVVCIGWRGREEHFLQLLGELRPETPMIFVDPDRDAAVEGADLVRRSTGHRELGIVTKTFEGVLADPESSPLVGPTTSWHHLG